MAKKQSKQRIIDIVSRKIEYLYDNGIIQSCIINSAILLVLFFIAETIPKNKLSPIKIVFEDAVEAIDLTEFEEIEIDFEESEKSENKSSAKYSVIDIETTIEPETVELVDIEYNHAYPEIIDSDFITQTITTNIPTESNKKTQQLNMGHSHIAATTSQLRQNNAGLSELNRRLKEYGARTGDIQISLSWNTIDDIDLHVLVLPISSNINWTQKVGICGGRLDIDMNAHPFMLTNRPIENVFWHNNSAPRGLYKIGIHNYKPWSNVPQTSVLLVVKLRDEIIHSKQHIIHHNDGVKQVFEFNF